MIAHASQLPDPMAAPDYSRRPPTRPQKALALDEICQRICEAADLPLSRAGTIPPQAYTSEEFFDWEVEHILRKDWQCVGACLADPCAGDFLNIDLLGEPLIVVHGKEGDRAGAFARLSAPRHGHHAGGLRLRWPWPC